MICHSAEIQGRLLPTFSFLDSVLNWIREESTYLLNVALCIILNSKEEWKGKNDLLLPESWSVFNVKQSGVLKTGKVVVMKRGTLSMYIRKYFLWETLLLVCMCEVFFLCLRISGINYLGFDTQLGLCNDMLICWYVVLQLAGYQMLGNHQMPFFYHGSNWCVRPFQGWDHSKREQ